MVIDLSPNIDSVEALYTCCYVIFESLIYSVTWLDGTDVALC